MSRFIFLSFAFLGWGFYELSGGSSFAPPNRPNDTLAQNTGNQVSSDKVQPPAQVQTERLQQAARQRAASLVAPTVLQPRPPSPRIERPAADPQRRQAVALSQIVSAGGDLGSSASAFAATGTTSSAQGSNQADFISGGLVAITAQLENERETQQRADHIEVASTEAETADLAAEEALDIRRIRASRVNMRQGPGTIYPVIARLLNGDEVQVIDDSGTGWLHLRARKGDKIGWVAASLVSRKSS
ncbi:SH3 domain-containing protein [Roseobacter sp. SK209-2-6]|uniref:SH3 domain-containing protein n=1 Tax=Roseobacter sp. SK209-2-6 TaxID=388739 RepID=UPI0002D9FB68|nr:SH3 domain-containing protein [Roseobacter sp. SK209-2-6]